ncbi:MAG: LysR family transcriptional regulator [Gammaproteobacteria bacterium]|nr:LysR family transcriptional regulator [Gammaproteobacteria bacterium]MCY4226464.1 LysR family transcriptional regulator [Gammaproteobacteria bacterium]MCY4314092.1 LysR family transcriptional regulator [Gammaproteobacteria bacterium]
MLTFRQIRYFIATVEQGKVSSAAAELNVSQSAVSAAIKDLEEELGYRLFTRKAYGVALTFQGHQFFQHARNILAAVSEAVNAPHEPSEGVEGDIVIGVSFTVAAYFLPNLLLRFKHIFPGVTTRVVEDDREEIERGLIKGRLDLALMLVSNLKNRSEIDSETLLRSHRRLWLSANHPFNQLETVSLAEIQQEPYVMLTVDEASKTAMRYWKKTEHRPNVIFETSSVEAVRSMVALGMGITILSDMVYRPWSLEGHRVETKNVLQDVPTMDVGVAWHHDAQLSLPSRTFRDFVIRAYQNSPLF